MTHINYLKRLIYKKLKERIKLTLEINELQCELDKLEND